MQRLELRRAACASGRMLIPGSERRYLLPVRWAWDWAGHLLAVTYVHDSRLKFMEDGVFKTIEFALRDSDGIQDKGRGVQVYQGFGALQTQ